MGKEFIVTGQKVNPELIKRAKELRQEMTLAERCLWNRIRANQLGGWHFRRQQIINGFIVDFYCHKAELVIEMDGPIHRKQKVEDAEREKMLSDLGLHILRFTNHAVMNNLEHVVKSILDFLETNPPFQEERG
jgi:very-short-patch-repair endonuclease